MYRYSLYNTRKDYPILTYRGRSFALKLELNKHRYGIILFKVDMK